jgi:hypothetical protein
MKIYIAFCRPDGDWDNDSTILGAFSTREHAEQQRPVYDPERFEILECELDILHYKPVTWR